MLNPRGGRAPKNSWMWVRLRACPSLNMLARVATPGSHIQSFAPDFTARTEIEENLSYSASVHFL